MEGRNTIKEVAQLAGVSVATVSRVLCESDYPVSAQLKEKVKDAAQTLGYVPNAVAKSLRKANYKDIGVVIPNITNPFYVQALHGINEILAEKGYSLILCNTMNDAEKEKMYLHQLAQRQVSGVILSSVGDSSEVAAEYASGGVNFVLLDQRIDNFECPSISYDTGAGVRIAMEHLIAMGHRRIAFATLAVTRWTRTQMMQGYQEALVTNGMPFEESLVYIGSLDTVKNGDEQEIAAGRQIAEAFIGDNLPATAILCMNDMLAIGLMQNLLKNGVKIPEDVSIMGFDDIPFAEMYVPALTTVRYPAKETGRLAAMLLLNPMMSTAANTPLALNLTPQLVSRSTVRCIV